MKGYISLYQLPAYVRNKLQ